MAPEQLAADGVGPVTGGPVTGGPVTGGPGFGDSEILALLSWLVERSLESTGEQDLLAGLCERLVDLGLPLVRAMIGSDVLHPTLESRGFRWERGAAVEQSDFHRTDQPWQNDDWLRSPFAYMLEHDLPILRRRLEDEYREGEFPLLDRLHSEGATDYLAFVVRVGEPFRIGEVEGLACSWTIDRPGGYTEGEVALLKRVVPVLALGFNALSMAATGRIFLTTYLGQHAAEKVLQGNIVRGRVETVRAVIWYSDLAGFTRIADEAEHDPLLGLLNDYAECLADVIEGHGGHVLKFVGDGILAIFPGDDAEQAATAALNAALAAETRVGALNRQRRARGEAATDFYIALHAGNLLYGNFGSRNRLDFTVLGPAVNEASRMAALCRTLEQRIVFSSAFAGICGPCRASLVSLGRYALRGVARPQELFTVDRDLVTTGQMATGRAE